MYCYPTYVNQVLHRVLAYAEWVVLLPQEWQDQDNSRTIACISHICKNVANKCHREHRHLWPEGLLPSAIAGQPLQQSVSPIVVADESTTDDFLSSVGLLIRYGATLAGCGCIFAKAVACCHSHSLTLLSKSQLSSLNG